MKWYHRVCLVMMFLIIMSVRYPDGFLQGSDFLLSILFVILLFGFMFLPNDFEKLDK